eukprot:snap_masked-scaffold1370_size45136-processed-gene-0.1 protein:Tk12772 transcript:snap_masked-scaffold1370_size45136-processed-gene-0.1-mRNA-1 annotation:"hypothetical protein H100_00937"
MPSNASRTAYSSSSFSAEKTLNKILKHCLAMLVVLGARKKRMSFCNVMAAHGVSHTATLPLVFLRTFYKLNVITSVLTLTSVLTVHVTNC